MKCAACGCETIEFSRFEEIGMNASEVLLERCEQQQEMIKKLETKLKEAVDSNTAKRKKLNDLYDLVFKLDEIREYVMELFHKEDAE